MEGLCKYCYEEIKGRARKFCCSVCSSRYRQEKKIAETDRRCRICKEIKDLEKGKHICDDCKKSKTSERNKSFASDKYNLGKILTPKSEFSMKDYRSRRVYYSELIKSEGFKQVLNSEIENLKNLLNELEFSDNLGQQVSAITKLITFQNNLKAISAKGDSKC